MRAIIGKNSLAVVVFALTIGLLLMPGLMSTSILGAGTALAADEAAKHERSEPLFANPMFWFGLLGVGIAGLFVARQLNMLDNTVIAVIVSLIIAVSYFHIVDHYLMDMQGLDYWYLFRG